MNNIAQLQQVNFYNLTINGVEYSDFKLESEWEGFAKFKNKEGCVIVQLPIECSISSLFSDRFSDLQIKDVAILKASPCFL